MQVGQLSHKTMLGGIDRIRPDSGDAEAIRTGVDECAELGVIPALVEYPVPGAVANLRRANPTLSAEVKVLNTLEIADALLLQQLAVGVVSPAREYDGLAVLHEFCTPHVCLVPRDHDLARDPGPVMLATLSDEELVTFDSEFLRALGLSGRVVDRIARRSRLFSRSNPAIAALANATRSVCIVDPFTARTAVALHGTVSRPLVEELPYRVAIVVRDKVNLSIAARRLVDALEEAFVQAAGELPVCRLS